MHRCSAGRPSALFAQSRGCLAFGSATLLPSRPGQHSHRKFTSLAHVNISLGLFLEVQESKIFFFLRLQSQAENNEDGIRETVEEPLMNIYYLHSTHG